MQFNSCACYLKHIYLSFLLHGITGITETLIHEHHTQQFFCFTEQTVWSVFLSKKECCTILLLGHGPDHGIPSCPKMETAELIHVLRPNGLKLVYLPGVLLSIPSEKSQRAWIKSHKCPTFGSISGKPFRLRMLVGLRSALPNILHRTMLRSSRPHVEQYLFKVPSPHSHLRVAAPSTFKGAFQTSDGHRARR